MWVKTAFDWIETKWVAFEAWMDSWAPGAKTRVVSFLGMIGSAATFLQQYVTGLPVTAFVTAEQLGIATAVLFTLAFWLRGLGDRVDAREAATP